MGQRILYQQKLWSNSLFSETVIKRLIICTKADINRNILIYTELLLALKQFDSVPYSLPWCGDGLSTTEYTDQHI